MDLEQQLQLLIQNAPQDGITPTVMEQAIAPVLEVYAHQLKHLEYYILQTVDSDWVMTTLSNRAQPNLEKKVIYAFPSLQDAATFQGSSDPNLMALAMPTTHILFQMFALEQLDSTVFMEVPGNLSTGVEVRRTDLQNLIQKQLEALGFVPKSSSSNLPPDIA